MTASDHKKVLKQIGHKPGKYAKFLKNNVPKDRKFGESTKKCGFCGRTGAIVGKYDMGICRHCFREHAKELGFKQYN